MLTDLREWSGGSEPDSYPYFKDLFCVVFGYPKKKVRINASQASGIPDLSLFAGGAGAASTQPWIVCEVKPAKGHFRDEENRKRVWEDQLKRYVTSDTVYALLLDPTTIVVLFPNGQLCGEPVFLESSTVDSLCSHAAPKSVGFLSFETSVGPTALSRFVEGTAPTHYLDVRTAEGQASFEGALRVSARELQDYALARVDEQHRRLKEYQTALAGIYSKSIGPSPRLQQQEDRLKQEYAAAIELKVALASFEATMGRDPTGRTEDERDRFVQRVYAVEAANLVMARILFVRFFEDYDMVNRKISNGGIKAFRDFHRNIQDDYRFLLEAAFRDLKQVYSHLFEKSVFDWAHDGNGELSHVLLRVFYRLNAFDFTLITGDNLGNLYERFLDPKSRKELGEYYTPEFVVDYILEEVGFTDSPGPLLDPACGSGTFLYRAIEAAIQKFRAKGIPYDKAIEEAVRLVHGIDINIFAAFIAQLQVIWHLFPHLRSAGIKTMPNLNIYGGTDSLDNASVRTFEDAITLPREAAARTIRDSAYRYVVGNPPYVRGERLKSKERWQNCYPAMGKGNIDLALYFIQRAIGGGVQGIDPWLEQGGRLGFIVSFGVADSKVGQGVRKSLRDNHLISLTDLESLSNAVFSSGMAARSTVAPIVIVAERGAAPSTPYPVVVTVATINRCVVGETVDLSRADRSTVPSEVFADPTINPFQHFITKISDQDVKILRCLFGGAGRLKDYASVTDPKAKHVAVTFGVKVGSGKGRLFSEPGHGRYPMAKAQHIHTFSLNRAGISEYVALTTADSPSVWGHRSLIGQPAYILSLVCYVPQCCPLDTSAVVAQNSCIVFVPKLEMAELPWDLYLNSSVVRFEYLLIFRSALVEGEELWRSSLNPDSVKEIPVRKSLIQSLKLLRPIGEELRDIGARILNQDSLLDEAIDAAEKVSLATLDARFEEVTDFDAFRDSEPRLEVTGSRARLRRYRKGNPTPELIEGDSDVIVLVDYMMKSPAFRLVPEPGARIPRGYRDLSARVRQMDKMLNPDVSRFRALYAQADRAISIACGLSEKDIDYVTRRLGEPPFNMAEPRWPWVSANLRATRTYTDDRYG